MNAKTQKTMFSSASDDWATPQDLFDKLNAEFGPFELDVCATRENRKCESYFGPDHLGTLLKDGLTLPWHVSSKVWMNPPYGRQIGKWVKKAYEESLRGCLVVALLPSRTDTSWYHDFIYRRDSVDVRFLRGRLKFGGAKNSAPFPSMIVIFRPPTRGAK